MMLREHNSPMTRTRTALTLTALGLAGLLGLTACGIGAGPAPAATAADVADEAVALQAVGLQTALEATPAPSASAAGGPKKERRHAVRKYLRKNTLHGEMTVQGKDGVRTIVVQRGKVTAVTGGRVSVESADGFALTWTLGDKVRVVQDKEKADTSAVKAGVEVGLAGARDGDATTARLIVIR
jgi:hypothetical protein